MTIITDTAENGPLKIHQHILAAYYETPRSSLYKAIPA